MIATLPYSDIALHYVVVGQRVDVPTVGGRENYAGRWTKKNMARFALLPGVL